MVIFHLGILLAAAQIIAQVRNVGTEAPVLQNRAHFVHVLTVLAAELILAGLAVVGLSWIVHVHARLDIVGMEADVYPLANGNVMAIWMLHRAEKWKKCTGFHVVVAILMAIRVLKTVIQLQFVGNAVPVIVA